MIDRESKIYYGPNNLSSSLAPEDFLGQCMATVAIGGFGFGGTVALLFFGLPVGPGAMYSNSSLRSRWNATLLFPLAKAVGIILTTSVSLSFGANAIVLVGFVSHYTSPNQIRQHLPAPFVVSRS
jgi:hypothetical protein